MRASWRGARARCGAGGAAAGAARARGAAGGGLPAPPPGPTAQEQIIARGWGYASVNTASIQADNGQGLTFGIIGLVNKGQPRKLDDWGVALGVGLGHEPRARLLRDRQGRRREEGRPCKGTRATGKAALVAMAYDERFAIGFISSSGQAGAKLHRRKYGETDREHRGDERVSLDGRQLS